MWHKIPQLCQWSWFLPALQQELVLRNPPQLRLLIGDLTTFHFWFELGKVQGSRLKPCRIFNTLRDDQIIKWGESKDLQLWSWKKPPRNQQVLILIKNGIFEHLTLPQIWGFGTTQTAPGTQKRHKLRDLLGKAPERSLFLLQPQLLLWYLPGHKTRREQEQEQPTWEGSRAQVPLQHLVHGAVGQQKSLRHGPETTNRVIVNKDIIK